MLHYDGIDVYEDIDVNKTSASKECIIRCYCVLLWKKGLSFNRMSLMIVMIYNDVYEPQQYCYQQNKQK